MKRLHRFVSILMIALILVSYSNVFANAAWGLDSRGWYYLDGNGHKVTNAWMRDSKGWCYIGSDGYMVTNAWVRDSKGWCFIGYDGYCVTNCWKRDSIGWIYLNSEGSMTKNAWVKDGGKWYYLNEKGYMATNAWKKDSKGWVYCGADGAMLTNAWCKDSKGWCYVGADGYAVTNCWKRDSKGWVYLNSNGSMVYNSWIENNGNWYYVDSSGYRVVGWTSVSNDYYYFYDDGILATNTWIDGLYVDNTGRLVDNVQAANNYLKEWICRDGVTTGGYTSLRYNTGIYTYSLKYSAQYDDVSVTCSHYTDDGTFVFVALYLDNYFYGSSFGDLEMTGYIPAATFTTNTAITYGTYNGNSSTLPAMSEYTRVSICDLLSWLDWYLSENNAAVTLDSFGFYSFVP